MLPLEKLNSVFRAPVLTRRRIALAMFAAVAADGLQILFEPVAWMFIPSAIDIVAMILTIWILGFHILLLPTFVLELVPYVDALPTWTACVAAVIVLRKREQSAKASPPPSPGSPPTLPPPTTKN